MKNIDLLELIDKIKKSINFKIELSNNYVLSNENLEINGSFYIDDLSIRRDTSCSRTVFCTYVNCTIKHRSNNECNTKSTLPENLNLKEKLLIESILLSLI